VEIQSDEIKKLREKARDAGAFKIIYARKSGNNSEAYSNSPHEFSGGLTILI
jgi:hypothetical protein